MNIQIPAVMAACLALMASSSGAQADRDGTTRPGVPPGDSHAEVLDAVFRLQSNPWKGWPVGTRLVVGYLDSSPEYPNVKHYAQSNVNYKVTGDGTTFGRGQNPDETVLTQHFDVANEQGLPSSPKLSGEQATPTKLIVDGIEIECEKTEHTMVELGTEMTTTYWVARARPEVLLRRETGNGNYWQIEGLATRKIGKEEHRCVTTRNRMALGDGFVVTIEYRHSSVPGHVVERVSEFHSGNSTPERPVLTMVVREKVILVDVPKHGDAESPEAVVPQARGEN